MITGNRSVDFKGGNLFDFTLFSVHLLHDKK